VRQETSFLLWRDPDGPTVWYDASSSSEYIPHLNYGCQRPNVKPGESMSLDVHLLIAWLFLIVGLLTAGYGIAGLRPEVSTTHTVDLDLG
jgi:hypothetical protein